MSGSGARLTFRREPSHVVASPLAGGEQPLGLDVIRDGLAYVPDTVERNAPVIVFLHGAGGTGRRELRVVVAAADRYGAVVVAPDSRGPTWDIIRGGFGPDVAFLDRVLDSVVSNYAVDVNRLIIGGVSDGASYALSIGLSNGNVFGSVIAFSPGFIVVEEPVGQPNVFVSHGTSDPILPIDGCSRRIVAGLTEGGYEVTYREFDGGHTVPPVIADQAFAWWVERLSPG